MMISPNYSPPESIFAKNIDNITNIIHIDIPYPQDIVSTDKTIVQHYLDPIRIPYLAFHNLFFYENKQFTPNKKLLEDLNLQEYILNDNRTITRNNNTKKYNIYNLLKDEYKIHTLDIKDKINFTKQIKKINKKTLFECDDISNLNYTFTLDDLFHNLNGHGFIIDTETGMPQQNIWLENIPSVNIKTRFEYHTKMVDVLWPFEIDFSPPYGLACWFNGDRYKNYYITLEELVYHYHTDTAQES